MSANPSQNDSFLTVAEVADLLKLNQQTVRNWIDQGSLPALRVGRRVRIKRSDFERVLAESYSGGPSPADEGGPSAEDFWGGEPVGLAEPDPTVPPPSAKSAAPGALGADASPGLATPSAVNDPAPRDVAPADDDRR